MSVDANVDRQSQTATINGWLVVTSSNFITFEVRLPVAGALAKGICDGDAVIVVGEGSAPEVKGVGRIYRTRSGVHGTMCYFSAWLGTATPLNVGDLGIGQPIAPISRLDWPTFETVLKRGFGVQFDELPVVEGKTAAEQSYLRKLLQLAVLDDLLGPANGPEEEVVGMSVRDRYLVGKLAPKDTHLEPDHDDQLGGGDDDDEGVKEVDASKTQTLVPSSFGMTVCIAGDATEVEIEANWGRYERRNSETATRKDTGKPEKAWKRIPSGGRATVPLKEGGIGPLALDASCPDVIVQG